MNNKTRFNWVTILLVGLLMIGIVNASILSEWDNRDYYDESKEEIIIKNWLGFGEDLQKLTLQYNSPTCSDDCLAEIPIILYKDGTLAEEIVFETIEGEIRREEPIKSYKLEIKVGEKVVEDYKDECIYDEETLQQISCKKVLIGNHVEGVYEDYNLGDEKPAGTYFLRLTGKKEYKKRVDWILTSQGRRLDVWAEWGTGSLLNDPAFYWTMDEASGEMKDFFGRYNGTVTGATYGSLGKINNSLNFVPDTDYVNVDDGGANFSGATFSVNAWINPDSFQDTSGIITADTSSGWGIYFHTGGFTCFGKVGVDEVCSGTAITTGSYQMVTVVYNSSGINYYKNGVYQDRDAYSSTFAQHSYQVGRSEQDTKSFDGDIDEIGVWRRQLTQGEITELYNSGNGLQPSPEVRTASVELSSPPNGSSFAVPTVDLSCNFTNNIYNNITDVKVLVYDSDNNQDYSNTESGLELISYNKTWTTNSLSLDNYSWACYGYGDGGMNASTGNWTFNISEIRTSSATQSYPSDFFNTTDTTPDLSGNFTGNIYNNITSVKILVYNGSNNLDYSNTESGLETVSHNKTWTTSVLSDGIYTWAIFGYNDGGMNSSTGNRTITIDATNPTITIENPTATNYPSQQIPFNSNLSTTATDSNLQACWYHNEYNQTNATFNCNTDVSAYIPYNKTATTWYAYANDSFGNLGSASVAFTFLQHLTINVLDVSGNAVSPVIANIPNIGINNERLSTIVHNNLSFFNDGDPYLANATIDDEVGYNADFDGTINFSTQTGEYNITLDPTKFALQFVNASSTNATANGTIKGQVYNIKTFEVSRLELNSSQFGVGYVYVEFNFQNDTNASQFFEFYNNQLTEISQDIMILEDPMDDVLVVDVRDSDNNAIREAEVQVHCVYPAVNWRNYTMIGQRISKDDGRANFPLYSNILSITKPFTCKIIVEKSGYKTRDVEFNPNKIIKDYDLTEIIKLERIDVTDYNGVRFSYAPQTYDNSTTSIHGAYYYAPTNRIEVTTQYRNAGGYGRLPVTTVDDIKDVYTFQLDADVDWDSTGSSDFIIETWIFNGTAYINWINSTVEYNQPTQIFDLADRLSGDNVRRFFIIALIAISSLCGLVTASPTTGFNVFMGGLLTSGFFMSFADSWKLMFIGGLYLALIVFRRINQE